MKNITSPLTLIFALLLFTATILLDAAAAQACNPSGQLRGQKPPPNKCTNVNFECCVEGQLYTTYECSPPVTQNTKATLTLTSFGRSSECDDSHHTDEELVVALSTGWFEDERRCFQFINITATVTGTSVLANVVDECDSSEGCDDDHDYKPPCRNDVVQGSKAVWDALGVAQEGRGEMNVTWSVV